MATMAVETEGGIQARIRETQVKIREAEQAVEAVVHELSGAEDLLSQLQAERSQECVALALGKARANPERFDRQIQTLKDRISGLENVKRRKELVAVDWRVELHDLHAESARLESEKAIREDGEEVRRSISSIEIAIDRRNDANKTISEGIARLRARKYLSEGTRRIGMDSAFRLDRINAGMRP
jgi:hypothetical protein